MARIHTRVVGQAKAIELPDPRLDSTFSLEKALAARRSTREYAPGALSATQVSQLLWAAQGITESDGSRTAPSAGGIHPLGLYLIAERVERLEPGLYAYVPSGHRLRAVDAECSLEDLVTATWEQEWITGAAAALAFTGDDERMAERYGERARRYVDVEAGHAIENAHLQATALGLGSVVVGAFDDGEMARRLGCGRHERPICVLVIGRR